MQHHGLEPVLDTGNTHEALAGCVRLHRSPSVPSEVVHCTPRMLPQSVVGGVETLKNRPSRTTVSMSASIRFLSCRYV